MTDEENQRLSRGLREIDTDEVDRAVDLLREAGFAVDGIRYVEPADHGVEFALNLYANSRSAKLGSGPAAAEVEEFRESFEGDEGRRPMTGGLNPEDRPGSPRAAVMDALRRLFVEDGVQENRLLKEAGRSSGFGQESLQNALDDLKKRGEVYVVEGRVNPTEEQG